MTDTSTDLDLIRESVRMRGSRYLIEPINGEPMTDYMLRCMEVGALLAVEPIATLNVARMARLSRLADDVIRQATTQREVATVVTSETEGTPA